MTINRKLAAILAADVVGYSRLMQQDEPGTLAALKQRRKEILDPIVARHQRCGPIKGAQTASAGHQFKTVIRLLIARLTMHLSINAATWHFPKHSRGQRRR